MGRPIAKTQVYVLDHHLQPVPPGATGELCISGDGLARGYLDRPELTAERFVANPFGPAGARMYRTGDLASFQTDGTIEYAGRLDQQVKIRGFRIELQEIEAVLLARPEVREAVVAARVEGRGDKHLVAYVVARDGQRCDEKELRNYLRQKLPPYMLPSGFVVLPAIPRTPNGKVDWNELPALEQVVDRDDTSFLAPRTQTEELLVGIWAQTLGLEALGINDNLFELGGHSLLATQIVSRIREVLRVELPIRALFESPTVASLAAKIQTHKSAAQETPAPPIVPVSREINLPLSFSQQRLWFVDQLLSGSPLYILPTALHLSGLLQVSALEQSINEIIRRHESLRTSFTTVQGAAMQVVHPNLRIEMPVVDLCGLPPEVQRAQCVRLTRQEFRRPFDLTQAPMLRATLVRLSPEESLFLFAMHHIVTDAWSGSIFFRELKTLYESYLDGAPSPLIELPIQYADFAVWQRSWIQGPALEAQLDYWRRQLQGSPTLLELPADHSRPSVNLRSTRQEMFALRPSLTEKLLALNRGEQVTMFMSLLAAFQTLLHCYTGQDKINVGTPIANRNRSETENLIGYFVNMIVLSSGFAGDLSFRELLRRVRETTLEAYANQDLPFEQLVDALQPERSLDHAPLAQVTFTLLNAPAAALDLRHLTLSPVELESGNHEYDVSVVMQEIDHGLFGTVMYAANLFERVTIRRMIGHLENLLESVVSAPERSISVSPFLSPGEHQQLLVEWNDSRRPSPAETSLASIFETQSARSPQAIALISGDQYVSYGALNQRANQLAHHLRVLGVGMETRVGVFMDRSVEAVEAIVAIIKAGGVYVPLDPQYPIERLAFMLEDAEIPVVLTMEGLLDHLPSYWGHIVCVDRDFEQIAKHSRENPARVNVSDQLAYVSYTSGSTGTPKAVAVRQRAVVRLVLQSEYVRFGAEQRLLHAAPLSFDASTFELWGGLLHGGTVVLLGERVPQAAVLGALIREQQVRTMWLTASLFNAVVDEDVQQLEGLEQLVIGGEALSAAHVERVLAAVPRLRLVNGYGPTEATTFACTYELSGKGESRAGIAIGRPIAETEAYVLGADQQLVPVGVIGELYLGGEGLARGYSNSSELTAEKFVPHGYSEQGGARLYRTGDLVRYRADGALEYVGRVDHQVKVRGFRIELGEIEAALRGYPEVAEAVVVVQGGSATEPGKRLLAYVVTEREPNVSQYQQYLRERLPEYMIPAVFVRLEQLPLTASGKVDRRALPAPSAERPQLEEGYVAASTATERVLVAAWQEVLKLEQVGIHDNFFELGGDSILSIRLASKGQERGLNFRLHDIFSYPTIHELAAVLDQREQPKVSSVLEPFDLISEADRQQLPTGLEDAYPLTRLQAGMLFHGHYEIENRMLYHSCFEFHLQLRWDEQAMSSAVERLIMRHAVLRTSFDLTSFSEPLQLVHRDVRLPLEITDLRSLSQETQQAVLVEVLKTEQERYFDWKQPPLIRFRVVRRNEETLNLVLTFHHAILDGWSLSTLLTELFGSYWHLLGESEKDIEPPPQLTYRHYLALEQQSLASEEARSFWDQWLSESTVLQLPQRYSVATTAEQRKRSILTVAADVADGLKRLAKDLGVPIKSVLLASHVRVLSWLGQQPDIVTGLVSHGRLEGTDGERVAGLFLNTLPLRVKLAGGTWAELVQDTFAAERQMLPHRLYPLSEIQRARGQAALFDVSFNYTHFHIYERLDEFRDRMSLLGDSGSTATNFTLAADFNVTYPAAQMRLILAHDTSQLSDAQMKSIEQYYARTLAEMARKPESRYDLAPLLGEAERHQLLREWCDTSSRCPSVSIAALFTRQAERTPDAVALISDEAFITYRELDRRSNQLGRYLRSKDVSAETLVGVCLDRSPELFSSILGIVKAGGVYVPLDPTYPADRLAGMIDDARMSLLLTQQQFLDRLPSTAAEVICLDTVRERLERENDAPLDSDYAGGDQPLYIIYTSGSTGRPKGVVGLQRGALNRFQWMWEQYPFTAADVCCQKTSLGFVDAVWEVFGALLQGVATAILDDETGKDPRRLLSALARHRVTRLVLVPSLLRALLAEQARKPVPDLNVRLWVSSGEALPSELVREFHARLPFSQLINLYGSSEVSADVSWFETNGVDGDGRVAIGRPIANTEMLLLDSTLSLVPLGVVGDLYVGGDGLARGYLRRPELTAADFLPHPFAREPGARIYRTGDTARYDTDGRLEYLGRRDHQVKIRGYRTELGEIEAALRELESVREAVVMLRDVAAEQRLMAYLVAGEGKQPSSDEEILPYLRRKLPAHMIPATFVWLDKMPLTPSGKIDRSALPAGDTKAGREVAYVGPRNAVEQVLADIWEPVLGKEKIGVHHNFFDLGGHSLLATRVVTRLGETFNLDLPLKYIFENPTISELGKLVVQLLMEEEARSK
ncbi:MAG TPA: amino acid adenylation domain-containing protein [Pyrinomonadaceae bacterium]